MAEASIIDCLKKLYLNRQMLLYWVMDTLYRTGSIMRYLKVITDPSAFQLLADDTRRKIVFLLRAKEMTVSQIAEHLGLTPQAVYHHIKKLVKANMVEVAREERVDHLIESYYRATAEVFNCNVGTAVKSKKAAKEQTTTVLNALKKLGFKLEYNEKTVDELVELQSQFTDCCSDPKHEEEISKMDDIDNLTKQMVSEYAGILSMSEKDHQKGEDIEKKTRNLLCSMLKK
jgi:DNA-binding transcriptional ArsR family regulator